MRREEDGARSTQPGSTPRLRDLSYARLLWREYVYPAMGIGLVGALFVCYLTACARQTVIQCDLQRLTRLAADRQAQQIALEHRLEELRRADLIRSHMGARHLVTPDAVVTVKLQRMPAGLWAEAQEAGSVSAPPLQISEAPRLRDAD